MEGLGEGDEFWGRRVVRGWRRDRGGIWVREGRRVWGCRGVREGDRLREGDG